MKRYLYPSVMTVLGVVSLVLLVLPFTSPAGIGLAFAVISGNRATAADQGIDQNSRVIDMSDTIHLLDPNEAALTAITMKLRKAHCINPKVEWLEDDYIPASSTAAATATAGTTAVTVAAGTGVYFRKGDVLKHIDSGETLYVSAVATDTLTVVRSIGAVAAATIDAADVLLVIGNANQEGATGRTVKTTDKTPQFNYTQIFRWPFGITRTLNKSELYGGSDLTYQTRKAGIEHRINMERAFLFGEKAEDTSGSIGDGTTPIRFCDGLQARISTNIDSVQTISMATFETFLTDAMRYGPARKIMFASRALMSFINELATNKIQTVPTTSSFPLALTEYISPHGKIYFVTHNLLTGTGANNVAYSGWGFLLDLDSIYYRYLQGSDTFLKTNIQANDEDGRRDEYISEACPMIIQEKNHAILNNVTDAA